MSSPWITPTHDGDYCAMAIERMQQDMSLKLRALCKELGISSRHLRRVFARETGIQPKQYQMLVRINHALEKLDSQQFETITDLAYECGYYDQSHFSHDFKEFTGMTPSEYISEMAPENPGNDGQDESETDLV